MSAITLLDYSTGTIEIIRLSPKREKELASKYDNDVESFLSERLKVKLSNCAWMYTDDYPEIYERTERDGKWDCEQVFTFE